MYRNILVVSDNLFLINVFHSLVAGVNGIDVSYTCSKSNTALLENKLLEVKIEPITLKEEYAKVIQKYDLVFSLHCKQLFPDELVQKIKCINVHPGFNPYNRGWFPQVFSIINGMKAGATIHEIDEQLDHGSIIAQKEVVIQKWDTSLTAYSKIQVAEMELLNENLKNILEGNYQPYPTANEGNVNLKKDYNALCEINLEEHTTMADAINYLRAMTHGNYKNAWFIDKKTGKKIYVTINLNPE